MKSEENSSNFQPKSGQIINSSFLNGAANMASDVMMLKKLNEKNDLFVRFYKWKGPWLSIGNNQKHLPKRWFELVEKRKLNIIRRPSGGSAVLHSGGLTYAFAWGSAPRKKHQAYLEASKWLIYCFKKLQLDLRFGTEKNAPFVGNCFATSSIADLVDQYGNKRIGSAQYWKKGKLLQHGEILLDPPRELWFEVFNELPPTKAPNTIPRKNLETVLTKSVVSYWPKIEWTKKPFLSSELKRIEEDSENYSVNLSNSDF